MDRPVNALLLPPGPRLYEALTRALDGTGPAVCPLSPDLPAAALDALLAALRPAAIETAEGITPYRPPAADPGNDGTAPGVESGPAVLIATSGSTGQPKIVELSAAALRHSATATLTR